MIQLQISRILARIIKIPLTSVISIAAIIGFKIIKIPNIKRIIEIARISDQPSYLYFFNLNESIILLIDDMIKKIPRANVKTDVKLNGLTIARKPAIIARIPHTIFRPYNGYSLLPTNSKIA